MTVGPLAGTRRVVPFDDRYRVPAATRVSRGVRCGDTLVTCGQMDLDADGAPRNVGDRWAQTERAMHLLSDVVTQCDMRPEHVVQLHVFFRGGDASAYRQRLVTAMPGAFALFAFAPRGTMRQR